jgi:hypothetical protein
MSDDTIRPFPGALGLPENPLQPAARHPGWCAHPTIVVDEHTRTIQCADPKCGAVLDAFDFVHKNAKHIQGAWDSHRQVMRQANEIAERLTVLKKEEQRLRAMIKRLQDKSGAVVNLGGKG